jgi:hypothetical protein
MVGVPVKFERSTFRMAVREMAALFNLLIDHLLLN